MRDRSSQLSYTSQADGSGSKVLLHTAGQRHLMHEGTACCPSPHGSGGIYAAARHNSALPDRAGHRQAVTTPSLGLTCTRALDLR